MAARLLETKTKTVIKMDACGECEKKLNNEGDFVVCFGRCLAKYHFDKCSGVSSNTWKRKSETKKNEWLCPRCRKQNKASNSNAEIDDLEKNDFGNKIDEEITDETEKMSSGASGSEQTVLSNLDIRLTFARLEQEIRELKKEREEVREMKKAMDFMNKNYEEVIAENIKLKTQISTMEERFNNLEEAKKEHQMLNGEIQQLRNDVREKDQYERNRNLEINGLDWLPNEDLPQVVQKVATAFGVKNYKKEMIDAAHRIPNKNKDKPSTLIMQFKHRDCRDAWLRAKKTIVTNDSLYRNGNGKRVYINENMSPYYRELFWKTKAFAKENGYKFVWFLRGKVMMKKNEGDKDVFVIKSEADFPTHS